MVLSLLEPLPIDDEGGQHQALKQLELPRMDSLPVKAAATTTSWETQETDLGTKDTLPNIVWESAHKEQTE